MTTDYEAMLPVGENELVAAALAFAKKAHVGQYRRNKLHPDDEPIPFVSHPIRVAALLWEDLKAEDDLGDDRYTMVAAALCHDILEDTDTRLEAFSELSEGVLILVLWLTNDESLKGLRKWRKFAMRERLSRAPVQAKIIKLADRWDNLKDFEQTDPEFLRRKYAEESRELIQSLEYGLQSACPACPWGDYEVFIKYRDRCVEIIERNQNVSSS